MNLAGKNVIYIGGFGGIGQKCLQAFLAKGIKSLCIFDLHENAELLKKLQAAHASTDIFFIRLDITDKASIAAAYAKAAARLKQVDVVVNGSGILDESKIDLTIQINLLGVIHSTLKAVELMDKSNGGRGGVIVNISSVVGLEPASMFAIYSASKAGVAALTRSLANPLYYARTGINFITVCPGFTDTAMLDAPAEKMTFSYSTQMVDGFRKVKRQTGEQCAENMVKATEQAKNGAVYMLDLGEMREVEFPTHWKPTFETN